MWDYERDRGIDADQQQENAKPDTGVTSQSLRAFTNGDAPIYEKQPDAISQMPNRCGDTDHVDDEYRDHVKLSRNDLKAPLGIMGHRNVVQSWYQPKPEIQHVKSNKEKQDDSGYSLDGVEPVARIWIGQVIRPRLHGDHQTIDGMIDERYKDSANFHE